MSSTSSMTRPARSNSVSPMRRTFVRNFVVEANSCDFSKATPAVTNPMLPLAGLSPWRAARALRPWQRRDPRVRGGTCEPPVLKPFGQPCSSAAAWGRRRMFSWGRRRSRPKPSHPPPKAPAAPCRARHRQTGIASGWVADGSSSEPSHGSVATAASLKTMRTSLTPSLRS